MCKYSVFSIWSKSNYNMLRISGLRVFCVAFASWCNIWFMFYLKYVYIYIYINMGQNCVYIISLSIIILLSGNCFRLAVSYVCPGSVFLGRETLWLERLILIYSIYNLYVILGLIFFRYFWVDMLIEIGFNMRWNCYVNLCRPKPLSKF